MSVSRISTHLEKSTFYVHSRDNIFVPVSVRSSAPKINFSRGKEKVARTKRDAPRSLFLLRVSFAGIRGETQCLKALPVIFRGVSAYLYRPRFRFYIASHRYAPRETALARDSLTISARLIFTKRAPSL